MSSSSSERRAPVGPAVVGPAPVGPAPVGDAALVGDAGPVEPVSIADGPGVAGSMGVTRSSGRELLRVELVAVAAAASLWLGIALAPPIAAAWPVPLAAGLGGMAAFISANRALAVGTVLLLGLFLGARADTGFRPVTPGRHTGGATAVSDPEPWGAGWRIELRLVSGARVQASGYGRAGARLSSVAFGERLDIGGHLSTVGDRPWLRARHIAGRLTVDRVEVTGRPGGLLAVPAAVRARLAAGADRLPDRYRPLYLGLVLGDDRFQPLGQQLRFRASGLTHLLAVSGQNVAFVLTVVRPLIGLLGYRSRLVAIVLVLATFAVVTRGEPSVLRATVTAGVAAWAAATGRQRSGLIVLSVAVMALLVVDPFLVDVVGFKLSVAASVGILAIGPAIERRIPGPAWLRQPAAVTLSAQLAVSPLLTASFGPMSLAAIPANLLAGWSAAVVMTLGLTTGALAGIAPPGVGTVVQFPVLAALWWLDGVATVLGRAPAPQVGSLGIAGLLAVAVFAGVARSWPVRAPILCVVVLVLVVAAPRPPAEPGPCGVGIGWLPAGGGHPSVLVVSAEATATGLGDCLAAGVRSVDVVVLERGDRSTARLAAAIDDVLAPRVMLAPPLHRVLGARRQAVAGSVMTAAGPMVLTPSGDRRSLLINPPR